MKLQNKLVAAIFSAKRIVLSLTKATPFYFEAQWYGLSVFNTA